MRGESHRDCFGDANQLAPGKIFGLRSNIKSLMDPDQHSRQQSNLEKTISVFACDKDDENTDRNPEKTWLIYKKALLSMIS